MTMTEDEYDPSDRESMLAHFRARYLPDAEMKRRFQFDTEGLLPELGDESLMPKLLVTHITGFDPVNYGVDYHVLAMDDFDDDERRHHYVRMLGERSAIDRRHTVLVTMASEAWASSRMYRKDGTRRYDKPADDPKRREIITVFSMSLDGRTAVAQTRVKRTLGGRFCHFTALRMSYSFEPGSTFRDVTIPLLREFWDGVMSEKSAEFGL